MIGTQDDGSELLGEVEAQIAELARAPQETTLAYVTGMSAVTGAIDSAISKTAGKQDRRPVIACAFETYSQTKEHVTGLRGGLLGARVVEFDSGSTSEVERIVHQVQPDVLIAETIGNYINVPVLDADHLIENVRQAEHQPIVVLDNTLPLSTKLPLAEKLKYDDPIIVVESGTKAYTRNEEMLGIAFTGNEELHAELLKRRRRGPVPSGQSLERIAELLPSDIEDFDERNQRSIQEHGRYRAPIGRWRRRKLLVSHFSSWHCFT